MFWHYLLKLRNIFGPNPFVFISQVASQSRQHLIDQPSAACLVAQIAFIHGHTCRFSYIKDEESISMNSA